MNVVAIDEFRDEFRPAGAAAVENPYEKPAGRRLGFRRLDTVEMKSIVWIDRPLLQQGAFHLLVGKKGHGKGTWIALVASRVTRGDLYGRPRNVVVIASEDSDAIDIRPRVEAAGGDPSRVYTLASDDSFLLPRDTEALRRSVEEIGDVGLIVIDPIGNHLGGGDSDKEGIVRPAIAPLNDLADDLDTILLAVRHLTKNTSGGTLASVLGSTAWRDVPRCVLAVAADDEDEMLFHLQVVAGNRGPRGLGRTFRIEMTDIGLAEPVTRAVETDGQVKSVDELLGGTSSKPGKRADCRELILRELADGSKTMDYLKSTAAAEAGASGETVWRAANELKKEGKARPTNSGPGTPWYWRLTSSPESANPHEHETSSRAIEDDVSNNVTESQATLPDFGNSEHATKSEAKTGGTS